MISITKKKLWQPTEPHTHTRAALVIRHVVTIDELLGFGLPSSCSSPLLSFIFGSRVFSASLHLLHREREGKQKKESENGGKLNYALHTRLPNTEAILSSRTMTMERSFPAVEVSIVKLQRGTTDRLILLLANTESMNGPETR